MGTMEANVRFRELLEKIIEKQASDIRNKKITMDLKIQEGISDIEIAEKARLTQAIHALITQAIFRTEEGTVTVQIQSEDPETVTISVIDTGWIPDPQQIRSILDPTVSASQWSRDEGLAEVAMSLRLSAKFISLLGGTLERKPSSDGRTCFCFTLFSEKVKQANEGASSPGSSCSGAETAASASASAPEVPRILLVDDVSENRALLEVLLKKLGHRCEHSCDGKDAAEKCKTHKYDLILMDLQMPRMDGFEAMREIRSSGVNQQTPINREKLERKVWRSLAQVRQIQDACEGREILSFLEGDPDYQKAVETFVNNLPSRIEELKKAFEKRDMKELAFKIHALKGLGGFAGFPIFTEKAKQLEETVKAEDLDQINAQLEEMVQLCMRTRLKT